MTQPQLKVSLTGDPLLVGSLALGASTTSQGSESKRLLIRHMEDNSHICRMPFLI